MMKMFAVYNYYWLFCTFPEQLSVHPYSHLERNVVRNQDEQLCQKKTNTGQKIENSQLVGKLLFNLVELTGFWLD